ncbi:MAG TPA: phasin family protein [Azospirillaceae bacterium]|nr:phasin family protein [Azospirillaceae bacterium]
MPRAKRLPTAPLPQALPKLARAGAELTRTAAQAGEMSVAAGTTIAYRLAMMAEAAANPLAWTDPEFTLMGREKLEAVAEAGVAVWGGLGAFQEGWFRWSTKQAQAAGEAMAALAMMPTPVGLAEAQRRFAERSLAGACSAATGFALAASRLGGLGLAPIHRAASDNARRLARERQALMRRG